MAGEDAAWALASIISVIECHQKTGVCPTTEVQRVTQESTESPVGLAESLDLKFCVCRRQVFHVGRLMLISDGWHGLSSASDVCNEVRSLFGRASNTNS